MIMGSFVYLASPEYISTTVYSQPGPSTNHKRRK